MKRVKISKGLKKKIIAATSVLGIIVVGMMGYGYNEDSSKK